MELLKGAALGRRGEDLATRLLEDAGFQVVCRNYHSRYGEVDLIAEDSTYRVFVEVKARASSALGTPAQAVTPRKQQRVAATANIYCVANPTQLQPRFDVVEVLLGTRGKPPQVHWIKDAFGAADTFQSV